MRPADILGYVWGALTRARVRSALMLLAMTIGVGAIVILTALGEGARRYVVGEFASLGTNLVIVFPGRSETAGGGPTLFIGDTPRDLTIADAMALERSPEVSRVAPMVVGSAAIGHGGKEREVAVLGSTASLLEVRHWRMGEGRFLPPQDPQLASSVCVIGTKVQRELFGAEPVLGQWLRIGDRRFRVVGVLASEGRSLGIDVDDMVIVPVASAQALFNTPSLFRILVEARSRAAIPQVTDYATATIAARHQGEHDVTVVTQDAVLATFDRILGALTYAVGGIAAVSLAVAGTLIMNIMLVAVSQRTAEIGLLKALGAPARQIVVLFLTESTLLSLSGALIGLLVGTLGSWLIGRLYPVLPVGAPWWAIAAALGIALFTGMAFGVIPARRAARLDPVQALAQK